MRIDKNKLPSELNPDKLLNKPFDYKLIDSERPLDEKTSFPFGIGGCAETDNLDVIKRVASIMSEDMMFMLGDNLFSKGTMDHNDPGFKEFIHDVHLKRIIFAILGNHDCLNDDSALAQILHTFVNLETNDWDKEKIAAYQKDYLDLKELRKNKNKWNMPGRYGVYHIDDRADIFVIDSSNFVKDFIKHFIKKDKNPDNQAAWLFKAVKSSKAKKKILLSHHPLFAIDKRNKVSDHPDYLSPQDIQELAKYGITGNYNEILQQILFFAGNAEKEIDSGPGTYLNDVYVAHHHALSHMRVKVKNGDEKEQHPFNQWISGGLGGPPQPRYVFNHGTEKEITFSASGQGNKNETTNEAGKTTLKNDDASHGYIHIEIESDGKTSNSILTLDGKKLTLHNDGFVKKPREEKIARLEKLVLDACHEFQNYLAAHPILKLQPIDTKLSGKLLDWVPSYVHHSDILKNFFNQTEAPDFKSAVTYLAKTLKECSQDTPEQEYKKVYLKKKVKVNLYLFTPEFDADSYAYRFVSPSPEYYAQLAEYQKQWHNIFEKHLLATYGSQYSYSNFLTNFSSLFSEKSELENEISDDLMTSGVLAERPISDDPSLSTVEKTGLTAVPHLANSHSSLEDVSELFSDTESPSNSLPNSEKSKPIPIPIPIQRKRSVDSAEDLVLSNPSSGSPAKVITVGSSPYARFFSSTSPCVIEAHISSKIQNTNTSEDRSPAVH